MLHNTTRPLPANKPNYQPEIKMALDCLHSGGILLFPTDYSWALGCDATQMPALQSLLSAAKVSRDALVLLVDSFAKVEAFVNNVPPIAWDLNEVAEQPLNMVLEQVKFIDEMALGKERSAAFRISSESFSKELCMRFKKPIAIIDVPQKNAKVNDLADLDIAVRSIADYCVKYFAAKLSTKISGIRLKENGVFEIVK